MLLGSRLPRGRIDPVREAAQGHRPQLPLGGRSRWPTLWRPRLLEMGDRGTIGGDANPGRPLAPGGKCPGRLRAESAIP